MEKTKQKLLLFYHYRKKHPFYFGGFSYDNPKIKRVLDKGAFLPLPAYDALGRRILVSETIRGFFMWMYCRVRVLSVQVQVA